MKKLTLAMLLAIILTAGNAAAFGTETLIPATTTAATYDLTIPAGHASSIQLIGVLSGVEEITLQRWITGEVYETLELDGSAVPGLSDTNHLVTFYGGIKVRINKLATAAAAGVLWVK